MRKVIPIYTTLLLFSGALFLFLGALVLAEQEFPTEGLVKVTNYCYFEANKSYSTYGTLHFRGIIYGGPDFMLSLYGMLQKVEGIKSVTPQPYEVSLTIGRLYAWDEVLERVKKALIECHAKKAKPKKGIN